MLNGKLKDAFLARLLGWVDWRLLVAASPPLADHFLSHRRQTAGPFIFGKHFVYHQALPNFKDGVEGQGHFRVFILSVGRLLFVP